MRLALGCLCAIVTGTNREKRDAAEDAAVVHDLREAAAPMLERMHKRRRKVMQKEGLLVRDEQE